jgi:predicted TIM-barrel fold metal-dependent hydrolase
LGLRGLKILAPALEARIDDRALYPLWEAVEELSVHVLIHFGMLGAGGGIAWSERDNPGVWSKSHATFRAFSSSCPTSGFSM